MLHYISLGKAISWRFVATLTTAVITYIITNEIKYALTIGGLEFFFKIFIYYLHERLWANLEKLPLLKSKVP